ncbi:unnamed protein product [Prorocentrum cordatum]|uniref:Uncharacterized protein n=1 Tax=Prorocentrum cordatum TaxID=2364126 RepID=A0ABN9TIZ0_9DINO|nr:unnamed protein product [Polarella glacialis]
MKPYIGEAKDKRAACDYLPPDPKSRCPADWSSGATSVTAAWSCTTRLAGTLAGHGREDPRPRVAAVPQPPSAGAVLDSTTPRCRPSTLPSRADAASSSSAAVVLESTTPRCRPSTLPSRADAASSSSAAVVRDSTTPRCRPSTLPTRADAASSSSAAVVLDSTTCGVFVLRCRRPGQHHAALQAQHAGAGAGERGASPAAGASRCGVLVFRRRRPGQHHAALQAQLAGQGGRRSEGDCCCGIRVLWPCAFAALRHGGVVLDSATPRRRPSAPGLRCALGTAAAPSGPAGPVASSDQRRGPGLERAPLHKGAPRDVRAENDQEDAHH